MRLTHGDAHSTRTRVEKKSFFLLFFPTEVETILYPRPSTLHNMTLEMCTAVRAVHLEKAHGHGSRPQPPIALLLKCTDPSVCRETPNARSELAQRDRLAIRHTEQTPVAYQVTAKRLFTAPRRV